LKREGLEGIGDILGGMIRKTKLGKHLQHAQIWEEWARIVGPKLATRCRPKTVKKMRLDIEADTAVTMHEVSLKKWGIIKRVNTLARKELINDIYVTLLPDGDEVAPPG